MIKLKKLLSPATMRALAAGTAGAFTAEVVAGEKVAGQLIKNPEHAKFRGAVPGLLGAVLATGDGALKEAGIAMAGAGLAKVALDMVGEETKSSLGIGSVLMGNPMRDSVRAIGSNAGGNQFYSNAPDFTSNTAGEMDY